MVLTAHTILRGHIQVKTISILLIRYIVIIFYHFFLVYNWYKSTNPHSTLGVLKSIQNELISDSKLAYQL